MSREAFVPTDDACDLWTATSGDGPSLVLCHGGPGFWDDLEPVASMVDDILTVHRWDQRGAGRSNRVGPFSVSRSIADLEALRAYWGYENWIVAGHSWGASLALFYALTHPERTRALVYVSGVGLGQAWHESYREERRRRLGGHLDRWLDLRSKERSAEEEREYAALTWSADFANRERALDLASAEVQETGFFSRLFPNSEANSTLNAEMSGLDEQDLIQRCKRLRAPALVLHGDSDPRPVWALDSLVGALPDARLQTLPSCGHLPWREQPDLMREALQDFLASCSAMPGGAP